MTDLVKKQTTIQEDAQKYLVLLSQGLNEKKALEKVSTLSDGKVMLCAFSILLPTIFFVIGSAKWFVYLEAQGLISNNMMGLFLCGTGLPTSLGWIFGGLHLGKKFYKKKYNKENLLSLLTEDDRKLALVCISKSGRMEALMLEYQHDDSQFVTKYFGECNNEMLYLVRKAVDKSPLNIVDLADPESEAHKQIKPALKLVFKV